MQEYTGIVYLNEAGEWEVVYDFQRQRKTLPLYPGDVEALNDKGETKPAQVTFKVIDEFTDPELYRYIPIFEGKDYAKLVEEDSIQVVDNRITIWQFIKNLFRKLFKK